MLGATHNLAMVDDPIGVDGHHRHLPGDLEIGHHLTHRLNWYEIGVRAFPDVVIHDADIFVIGNDVEVDFAIFGGESVQRL